MAVAAGTAAPMAPKRPRYFIVLELPVTSAVMTFRRYRSFQEPAGPLSQITARLTRAGGGRRQRSPAASAPDPPGSRGYGGNRGVGRGDMRVWRCRGRPRSSRRPYGKEVVSNDHRRPAAVTTGDRRVRGPVLTFGREQELRIGLTGSHCPVPARLRNWLSKPEVYYGLLKINYNIGCKCD